MDKFVVRSTGDFFGNIPVSGSKNAALPLLFASFLSDKNHELKNVPRVHDMDSALRMLLHHGVKVEQIFQENFGAHWKIDSSALNGLEAPYDLVRKMRASFFCLGPLLARMGYAKVSLPGGCAIGARPVDLHLMGFKALSAEIHQSQGYVEVRAPKGGLQGAVFEFPKISVGATENLLMAATLAKGETVLKNAAREPEVYHLAEALIGMGAQIEGHGSSEIRIQGVQDLGALNYEVPGDRIEAGTYLIGAQLCGGDITLRKAPVADLEVLLDLLRRTGAVVDVEGDSIRVLGSEKILPINVKTEEYPGFATDLQAQWVALMTQAEGKSEVVEEIFENRFMHVPELCRMGAKIQIQGSKLEISGKKGNLQGAPVMATDLRASASLVLAGLVAEGETHVRRIYHLDRGYESMELKLRSLGADIERQVDS